MTLSHLASSAAPQQGPRPLPLFLSILRSETAASPERRAAALHGLRRYQAAPRVARPPAATVVARAGRACLRDYGGNGPSVVFVPSLINPPFVLDLAADNSLLRWLAAKGVRPLLVDWGTPGPGDAGDDIGAHVAMLLDLIATLDTPPILAGYCLGGTIATAAAAAGNVAGLALIATPWHFAGFDDDARSDIARLWTASATTCAALGLVPMELLQAAFWQLDPARTIAKFEAFGTLDPASDAAAAFVALEDWANAGAPLPFAAGRELFEDCFAADLPGQGDWRPGSSDPIVPAMIPCPVVQFVATGDRIVPAATAIPERDIHPVAAGHVGMIVGRRGRLSLWEPLADWLTAKALPR